MGYFDIGGGGGGGGNINLPLSANDISQTTTRQFVTSSEKGQITTNANMINQLNLTKADLVDDKVPVSQIPDSFKDIRVVADIASRDALEVFEGLQVLVIDAFDATGLHEEAEYIYRTDINDWYLRDNTTNITLDWSNILNKPAYLARLGINAENRLTIDGVAYPPPSASNSDSGYVSVTKLNRQIGDVDEFTLPTPISTFRYHAFAQKLIPGDTELIVDSEFNNADASDFNSTEYVEFDGTMNPKASENLAFTANGDGTIQTTIDPAKYKNLISVSYQ